MDEVAQHLRAVFHPHRPLGAWPGPEQLMPVLVHHGLAGVYRQVLQERNLLGQVPAAIVAALERQTQVLWKTGLQLAAFQDQAVALLGSAGIQCLVLKGLSLSERLYGNALVRPGGDVDLLVAPEDFDAAQAVLCRELVRAPEPGVYQRYRARHFHLPLLSARFNATLELHWALTDPRFSFPLSVREMLTQARPVSLSGKNLLVMDPALELAYLYYHNAMNTWVYRMVTLLDIERFATVQSYDQEKTDYVISRAGLKRAADLSKALCTDLFRESEPGEKKTQGLARWVLQPACFTIHGAFYRSRALRKTLRSLQGA